LKRTIRFKRKENSICAHLKKEDPSFSTLLLTLILFFFSPLLSSFCIYKIFNWFLGSLIIYISFKHAFGFTLLFMAVTIKIPPKEVDFDRLNKGMVDVLLGLLILLLMGYSAHLILI